MANCFLPQEPVPNSSDGHKKVAKKVKSNMYYSSGALAKNLLTGFSCFSKKSNKEVPISSLLKKLAKDYDNHHPTSASSPAKRIKVIITKQQLQELLSKKIELEDVLNSGTTTISLLSCITSDSTSEQWKPELESIPEGYEL